MSRCLQDGCLALAVTLLLTGVALANPDIDLSGPLPVPEPGTLLLVTIGGGALALWRKLRG